MKEFEREKLRHEIDTLQIQHDALYFKFKASTITKDEKTELKKIASTIDTKIMALLVS